MEEQEDFIAFSDSAAEEEEEGEHPADELIIKKAQDRQQSASTLDEDGASADEAPSSGRKRPRTSKIALNISHTGGLSALFRYRSQRSCHDHRAKGEIDV